MQSYFAPPGYSMPSGIALYEANGWKSVEVGARLLRSLDRPASASPAAVPKETPRQQLRRSLLILFPVLRAAVGLLSRGDKRSEPCQEVQRGSDWQGCWRDADLEDSARSMCQRRPVLNNRY